ncbi:MAG: hypothetical protein DRQ24_11725 [Candidatus Latescibacterota bacterium]|nr:MAG: hypothetical protein DRQ24_11725 [Candidatus Latescibacterota bacterium]
MGSRRLKDHGDVRRHLANVINRLEKGELEPNVAGKLGYLAGMLLKALEGSELAERVARLEQKIKELGSDKVRAIARHK